MQYVAGFLKTPSGVVFVRKKKPVWQKGKLNGVGGKVEDGEHPEDAMKREWKEETGHDFSDWNLFCELNGADFSVYFYKGQLAEDISLPDENDSGEPLYYIKVEDVQNHPRISNIDWLLALAFTDSDNPMAYVRV